MTVKVFVSHRPRVAEEWTAVGRAVRGRGCYLLGWEEMVSTSLNKVQGKREKDMAKGSTCAT